MLLGVMTHIFANKSADKPDGAHSVVVTETSENQSVDSVEAPAASMRPQLIYDGDSGSAAIGRAIGGS